MDSKKAAEQSAAFFCTSNSRRRHGRACPAIHVGRHTENDVDARNKPGHDGVTDE